MIENEFLNVDEIAELCEKLDSIARKELPRTVRGWRGYIKRQKWDEKWGTFSHLRDGQMVYNICLLPDPLRRLLPPPEIDAHELDIQREKRRKEAREKIVYAVHNYRIGHGTSQNAAVNEFVQAVEQASNHSYTWEPIHIQIHGFGLPYVIIPTAKGWLNTKGPWRVSRRTIYEWIAEVKGKEQPARLKTDENLEWQVTHVQKQVMNARACLSNSFDVTFDSIVSDNAHRIIESLYRLGYKVEREGD